VKSLIDSPNGPEEPSPFFKISEILDSSPALRDVVTPVLEAILRSLKENRAHPIARAARAREENERLREENLRLHEELQDGFHPASIIGTSTAMRDVYSLIARVSKSDAPVLVRGESGTGKELVAHAVHNAGRRAANPFFRVNCAALPEGALESELFGHEKGAFADATAVRKGRFELAAGGTLFLDEIGDLSLATQFKLLRVVREQEYARVGSAARLHTDVRLIAASSRDLEGLIEKRLFRPDLYHLLNVLPIHLPPLRERRTDILLLADFFAERFNEENHKNVRRISTPAIDMLMAYHWPGNVRELEECIESAVLRSDDEVIHGHHLSPALYAVDAGGAADGSLLKATLARVEKEFLMEALKSTRGNMASAAATLGITERVMGLRVRSYRIPLRRFKDR
jgi:Nif-specific regulatory protein